MSYMTTISGNGQVCIPKALMAELGMKKGDKLELFNIDGQIVIIHKNSRLDDIGIRVPNDKYLSVEDMERLLQTRSAE